MAVYIILYYRSVCEIKELIDRDPQCVYAIGNNKQTTLHNAVEEKQLETLQLLLDTAKLHPPNNWSYDQWINWRCISVTSVMCVTCALHYRDDDNLTALHITACCSSVGLAKLLVENRATVDPEGARNSEPVRGVFYYLYPV